MIGTFSLRVNAPDLLAALLFGVFGLAGLWFGWDLDSGSAGEMGPGYLPKAISWLLLAIGAILAIRAFLAAPERLDLIRLRPLTLILLAAVLFALLLERFGLVVTVVATVFLSCLSAGRFRPLRTAILALGLAVGTILLFVELLQQPIPVWGPP
jgi:hypothetical protein